MSSVIRSVKNVTKGYSSVQVKVRNGMPPLIVQAAMRCITTIYLLLAKRKSGAYLAKCSFLGRATD